MSREQSPTWPAIAAMLSVVAVYLGSLGGGWVWDDHLLYEGQDVLGQPLALLTRDHLAALSQGGSQAWRPLALLTFWPGAVLGWGPPGERALSLILHLGAVGLLAGLARSLGTRAEAAWLGAAVFGCHPAAVETVAWISSRSDLLLGLALVGGALLWTRGRPVLAAAVLATAAFCKEPAVLAPGIVLVWAWGSRTRPWGPLAVAILGVAAYVGLRSVVGIPWAASPGPGPLLAGLGGLAARGGLVAFLPSQAGPLAPLVAHPLLGGLLCAMGLGAIGMARGHRAAATLLGLLLPLAVQSAAAVSTGTADDRYLYLGLAVLGLGLALAAEAVLDRSPLARLAWLLPIALASVSLPRALEWRSDQLLFGAALARDPDNARLAFRLGYDQHLRQGDCSAAIPLYRQGLEADPRAGTNLQACLYALGQHAEALALAPILTERAPANPNPAANGARAALALGDREQAIHYARMAAERDPEDPARWVMLGQVLGGFGELDEAERAFQRALDLAPGSAEAAQGMAAVERARQRTAEDAPRQP